MVRPHDLTDGSNVFVRVKCDYCGKEYRIKWYSYKVLKNKENNTDCCGNPECTYAKSKETIYRKYHVDNIRKIDGADAKIIGTCLEKYGVPNPFQSEEIKKKIESSNFKKYGVKHPMQCDEVRKKAEDTCLHKYGKKRYAQTIFFRERFSGENSPTWKGGLSQKRTERATVQYRDWRKSIFVRDIYQCQCCGAKSAHGSKVELHAHHIFNWIDNPDIRFEEENGITLCSSCHYRFHSIYGKRNNNYVQLKEFLQMKRYAEPTGNELQEPPDKKPVG